MKDNKLCQEVNSVSIWIIPQGLSSFTPYLREILSTDEIERANKYYFYRDHTRFLNRRGIVRVILGNYLGIHPKNIQFEYTKLGKPIINGRFPIKFSLSASGEYACLAVSKVDVGIDIEKITPFENLDEISKQMFPQSIYLDITDRHERINIFYKWWTRMEAILKAKGTGFFHMPKDITSDHFQDKNSLFEMKTLKLLDIASPINYSAAVCLVCNWGNILLRHWKPCSNGIDISSAEQIISSYDAIEEEVKPENNYCNEFL